MLRDKHWIEGPGGAASLLASRCTRCCRVYYPAQASCHVCESRQLKQYAISGPGSLYSYTTIYVGSADYKPPYTVGYIDFPEGVRVFGHIHSAEESLRLGVSMAISVGQVALEDGSRTMYVFRVIEGE